MKTAPAMTNASLLASRTFFPAIAAVKADGRPAAPTIAAMTVSTSGNSAIRTRASGPDSTIVVQEAARKRRVKSRASV